MATETRNDAEQIDELTAIIHAVRDRVSARYPEPGRDEFRTRRGRFAFP